MELIDKFSSRYIPKIVMIPGASKNVSIKFAAKCMQILNNKERLNELKGITKI